MVAADIDPVKKEKVLKGSGYLVENQFE